MKQNNNKQEEAKTPEKVNDNYDALISELALNDLFQHLEPDVKGADLVKYLKKVIAEWGQLSDIAQKMEKDPRIVQFIERLLSGDGRQAAFESVGLSELVEGMPSEEHLFTPADISNGIKAFYTEKGVDKEVIAEFMTFVETFIAQIYEDEIGRNVLEVLWLAFMHENDVKKAYDEGVIKGQNKKIESLRFERNNVDGLGAIGGGAVSTPPEKKLGYIERLLTNN